MDSFKCKSCSANVEDTGKRQVLCGYCGAKVADWDDPDFGDNKNNPKFYAKQKNEVICETCSHRFRVEGMPSTATCPL